MTTLNLIITDAGRATIVNAQNMGTLPVVINQIALGTGRWAPDATAAALQAEIKRINTVGGQAIADDTIHVTITDSSSDAYSLGEFGLYTDGGVLFAIYSELDGIADKAADAQLLLAADVLLTSLPPGSVTVDGSGFTNPAASETVAGVAEIATQDETNAGTDDARIVTPKKLMAASTSTSDAGKLIRRDAVGRAKIAAPAASDDIARKDTVDAVQSNLDTHQNDGGAHGATSAATANAIVKRDAGGRAKVAAPVETDDIARKAEVDTKQNTIAGAASTITDSNLTASRALISDASGKVAVSAITSTELGYLDNVTSNIQTQLNGKANLSGAAFTGDISTTGDVSAVYMRPAFLIASGGVTNNSDIVDGPSIYGNATHSSYIGPGILSQSARANSTAYSHFWGRSQADINFNLRGDGTGLCDGSWTGGGADYAEYFEWEDGNPNGEDRRGLSVVLVGNKVRLATAADDPDEIIGVVSGNPSVVGDAAWNHWTGRYLRDDFGTHLREDCEAISWVETVTVPGKPRITETRLLQVPVTKTETTLVPETVEIDGQRFVQMVEKTVEVQVSETLAVLAPDGTPSGQTVEVLLFQIIEEEVVLQEATPDEIVEVLRSYYTDALPEGVIPPAEAKRETQKRRIKNPDYNPDAPYIPREERPEWDPIGLLGKLRIRKGQPVGMRWKKMRDISAEIEEWFVR